MNAAEALIKAEWLIGVRGWCQGRYRDQSGRYCAYGAICSIARDEKLQDEAENLLRRALPNGTASVITWNDRPERTAAEVRATLLVAAGGAT